VRSLTSKLTSGYVVPTSEARKEIKRFGHCKSFKSLLSRMRGLFLKWHQLWLCEILPNLGCKGNWHSGVNNLDLESISVKKAKSQITITEDIFPENKRFVSEPNEGQSLPYCATYRIENSLLVYLDYFQHLDLCFVGTNYILNALQQRYKSGTTTELQKYISVWWMEQTICCFAVREETKKLSNINLPFCCWWQ